jgi:hypothetical protein
MHALGWVNNVCIFLDPAPVAQTQSSPPGAQFRLRDWIEILAIFLGPITALWVQRILDGFRETRRLQESLYSTLMRLRAATLTPEYVNALNLIDMVFRGNKKTEILIRAKWKILMDHFNDRNNKTKEWGDKRQDLTVDLLAAVGEHLGFKFDPSHIKRQVYFPQAMSDQWEETNQLRKQMLQVLDGKGTRKIPVALFETKFPETK